MTRTTRISLLLITALAAAFSLACDRGRATADTPGDAAMIVGRENLTIASQETLLVGPAISGTIQAERQAQVRAEITGALVAVSAEPGQAVARGAVLGRIDDTGLRDTYSSARAALTTAEMTVELARRNAERSRALSGAGAIAERDLEQAEWNLSSAETQAADARARTVSAQKQLAKTVLQAPFSGIVSERPVNQGDIVQVGNLLFSVVDPTSLKLEGSIPTEGLAGLKVGTPVIFSVAGSAEGQIHGRISRINPVADPATRQVRVTVAIPNASGRTVAGLFADGRVATAERAGIVVPSGAVDRTGIRSSVVRVRRGLVERVEVELGLIDQGRERIEIRSGIAAGDTILLGGARGLPPGTAVRIGSPAELNGRTAPATGKE